MKLLEAMKKEFKLLRILWRQIYDNVRVHQMFLRILNFLFIIVFSREKNCLFYNEKNPTYVHIETVAQNLLQG